MQTKDKIKNALSLYAQIPFNEMKTLGLLISISFLAFGSFGQTTATDASPVDCNGVTHNLFSDLDAGKIIVIGWTMPCATCAAPLLEVHNSVLNYFVSNPGVVEYWLTDDFANTNCATIEGWASANGISNAIFFSSSELDMFDYGTSGMPKVVVVGCSTHKIYYNRNNSPTGSGVTTAINNALQDISTNACEAGETELKGSKFALTCFPNPATTELNITFSHEPSSELTIEMYSLEGTRLKSIELEKTNTIDQMVQVDVSDFSKGIYLLKLIDSEASEVIKIQIID